MFEPGDFSDRELRQIERDLYAYAEDTRNLAEQVREGKKVKAIRITKKRKDA